MSTPAHPPFTKNDLPKLHSAIRSLDNADSIIARAEAAGYDVSAVKADCQTCRTCLEGTLREFFGTRPSNKPSPVDQQ
jgi:hypothetical protein